MASPAPSDIHQRPRPPPSVSRRREKPQLSCNLCRRRKLRCDRQQPCSTRSSAGQPCIYPERSRANPYPHSPLATNPAAATPGMHERLVQLETLVMSMGSQSDPSRSAAAAVPQSSSTDLTNRGTVRAGTAEHQYVGGDHWAAILDNITELRHHFDREQQCEQATGSDQAQDDAERPDPSHIDSRATAHSMLLYGGHMQASRSDILAALPSKPVVDRYISRYFNQQELVTSTLHGPTFLQEYDVFWADPSSVPIMWIGLLYGMICLAVLASETGNSALGNEADQPSLQISLYHDKVVQCLFLGEYTRSGLYTLETVIHYIYIELIIRADADTDLSALLALKVKIAMRMGYHRDPSHFAGMSPLKSEMRRRLWATVLQGDILISSQMGLPRMIQDPYYDTAEPRNLNDADLDKDTVQLPPARPETEITSTLGLIARSRLLKALGTISDLAFRVKSGDYAEVMRADANLLAASASIPQPFKMKSMATSITDSPQVIMSRLFIHHLYYKGQITLHRRFVLVEPSPGVEDSFPYSRRVCVEASLGMLNIQHILDEETFPGGLLHTLRWRVSSMINHQFLTATMILCALLHREQACNRQDEVVAALRRTRTIWTRSISISREAKKAADTISIVLARAGDADGNDTCNERQETSPAQAGPAILAAKGSGNDLVLNDLSGLASSHINDLGALKSTPQSEHDTMVRDRTNSPTALDQQMSDFPFALDFSENGVISDEWMTMASYETWG